MTRKKLEFEGYDGSSLAALLELPDTEPVAYALFAHCFSCGKDIAAASRVSRALARRGIAVLRFDFTGLGNSDGDFANANFSSNVEDIRKAVEYMRRHYEAPALMVGHSLGGTAILAAAVDVPECRAVVSIGAPADPAHVLKQFSDRIDQIDADGVTEVDLAGRAFTIKKQFLDDVRDVSILDRLGQLRKALLVFHSPVDATVSINEAEKIYLSAKHPKSFVSLDEADHLVSGKADAEYIAEVIAGWASRYLDVQEEDRTGHGTVAAGEVRVLEENRAFTRRVISDSHHWLADEPKKLGGHDLGPDPYEHLLAALGTCTSMTIRMYANRKKLPLEEVRVNLQHTREHLADCENCDETPRRIETLHRGIELIGNLTDEEQQRLLEIADRCPVHRTLEGELEITSALEEGG